MVGAKATARAESAATSAKPKRILFCRIILVMVVGRLCGGFLFGIWSTRVACGIVGQNGYNTVYIEEFEQDFPCRGVASLTPTILTFRCYCYCLLLVLSLLSLVV